MQAHPARSFCARNSRAARKRTGSLPHLLYSFSDRFTCVTPALLNDLTAPLTYVPTKTRTDGWKTQTRTGGGDLSQPSLKVVHLGLAQVLHSFGFSKLHRRQVSLSFSSDA